MAEQFTKPLLLLLLFSLFFLCSMKKYTPAAAPPATIQVTTTAMAILIFTADVVAAVAFGKREVVSFAGISPAPVLTEVVMFFAFWLEKFESTFFEFEKRKKNLFIKKRKN